MPTSTPKKISQLNELDVLDLNEELDFVPILQGSSGETKKLKAVAFTTTTLPIATSSDLGGIKVGGTLAINAGTGVLNLGGLNSAGTYGTASAVPRITVDGYGRVTTVSTVNLTLGNITDVSLSTPSNQQVLRFNGTSGKWENSSLTETLTLDSLSDVGITGPASGQYLRYSGTAWVNGALGAGDLTGTIPSTVLGNSSFFIGTTSVALNRASGALSLTGVSIDGNSGTVTNGVYTTGSYSDPSWLTISKSKVGLGSVPNTDCTNASNISSGTLAAGRLPSVNIGTTSVDLTRASGALGLGGISTLGIPKSSNAPATPADGFTLYANSSNALSWKGANGFIRVFDGTANTADRSYTLPDASGTLVLSSSLAASATTDTTNATNISSGTLNAARLPSVNIGTTAVDLTRASGALALAGISTLTVPTSANPPATPSGGFTLYANSSNALSWKGQNGYLRVFDGTANTADRTYTLPDASGTVALTASPTFTGLVTVSDAAAATIETLTDAATVAVDLSTGCNFTVTLGGNRTLGNPTNATAGQSGSIFIVQDGTGSRTLAYGSNWKFAGGTAPTLSTAASAVDRLDYIVRSSTNIQAVLTKAYA